MTRSLSFVALIVGGVLLVALVYVAEWFYWRRVRLDGLQDPRVLRPVAERVCKLRCTHALRKVYVPFFEKQIRIESELKEAFAMETPGIEHGIVFQLEASHVPNE